MDDFRILRELFILSTVNQSNQRRSQSSGLDPFDNAFYKNAHKRAFSPSLNLIATPSTREIGQCCICLDKCHSHDSTFLPCGHFFHASCCDYWISKSSPTCPTCRANIHVAELMDGDVISVLRDDNTYRSAVVKRIDHNIRYSGFGEEGEIKLINPRISFIRDEGLMVELSKQTSSAYQRHKRRKERQKERKRRGLRVVQSSD